MINEIISLLPSIDLKAKIKETNYKFSEEELLQIIYRYAPTFEARLALLARFAELAAPSVSALAKVYIEYEQDKFKRFIEAPEGFVYELCIKEYPESYEETYLCSSYNAALVCIDRFFEEYEEFSEKNDKTRYKIVKRKIFSENAVFDEDTYAECVLGADKTVLEVLDHKNDPADCDLEIMCSECKELCPNRYDEITFPCFARNYAVVKYFDYEGKEHFGVNLCLGTECDGTASELYVVPLDSSEIRERRFDADFFDHQHLELPRVTLATPEDLDETMRKNYFDFTEYLKKTQNEG
ncbi:MAG: hypothetical protein IJW21_09275 [Clostridia bacterium]|nr:hypothetical protein [Clostridia bacterium]